MEIQDGTCTRLAEATVNISGIGNQEFDENERLSVYPNPSKNHFFVEQADEPLNEAKIRIIDGSGRIVFVQDLKDKEIQQIKTGLASGNYTLQIVDENAGIVFQKKISILQ